MSGNILLICILAFLMYMFFYEETKEKFEKTLIVHNEKIYDKNLVDFVIFSQLRNRNNSAFTNIGFVDLLLNLSNNESNIQKLFGDNARNLKILQKSRISKLPKNISIKTMMIRHQPKLVDNIVNLLQNKITYYDVVKFPFNKRYESRFVSSDGAETQNFLFSGQSDILFYEDKEIEAVYLDLQSSFKLFLLKNKNNNDLLDLYKDEDILDIIKHMKKQKIELHLPQIYIDDTYSLMEPIENLGFVYFPIDTHYSNTINNTMYVDTINDPEFKYNPVNAITQKVILQIKNYVVDDPKIANNKLKKILFDQSFQYHIIHKNETVIFGTFHNK